MNAEPSDHDDFDEEPTNPRVDHFYDDAVTASDLVRMLVDDALRQRA